MRALTLFALGGLFLSPLALSAQEEERKPEKYENVAWYAVEHIDFKPGKKDDAMKIVKEYFHRAGVEAGTSTPTMVLDHRTGPWDLTVIWHMKKGPSEMEWKQTEEGIAWEDKFVELAGGPEKAKEIGEKWDSYVARTTSSLAFQESVFSGMGEGM